MEGNDLIQGSELAGRYVLERRLGTGGMATVWLAQDTRLQRSVAVKLPSRELTADETFGVRFEREARTAAALSHSGLVPVFDFGTENGRPYLVSEFIDGATLSQLRKRGEEPETEELAAALLEALAHIHEADIVHRDIKPGNVLVDQRGRILLTDFGIAQSTEETRLTSTGMVIGTLSYLAPEVKRGERATPSSDLFACGFLLSEQLTERDPDRVARLVDALTETDPTARPADAQAALALLRQRNVVVTSAMPVQADADEGVDEPDTASTPARGTPAARVAPLRRLGSPPPLPPARGESDHHLGLSHPQQPPARRKGPPPLALLVGLGALIVAAIVGIALAGGDDGGGNGGGSTQGDRGRAPAAGKETTSSAPAEPTTTDAAPAETVPAGDDPAQGKALNDEGFALLQAGDVEGALPKLQASVASFPEDSTDINYAFALFNYAQALRLSGDPGSAIPLLEKRLSFSDYKVDEVQAELATAQEAAGVDAKPPKEPKAPKEPKE